MDGWIGNCTNYGECEAACPKEISLDMISQMNRDYAACAHILQESPLTCGPEPDLLVKQPLHLLSYYR